MHIITYNFANYCFFLRQRQNKCNQFFELFSSFFRKNGRYYCGHANCVDPSTGDVKDDAENWRSMTQVWRHFELCHASPSDFVFKCKQCSEGFTTRAFLNIHIKEKHEHQARGYPDIGLFWKRVSLTRPYPCAQGRINHKAD